MASPRPRRIDYLPLSELVPAVLNPKRHDLPALRRSMAEFGYVEPIVLDERTMRLVAGHGRLEELLAAEAEGLDPPDGVVASRRGWLVPVTRGWASRDDAQASAYLVASNRLVELGGWDEDALAALERSIGDAGLQLASGFDEDALRALLDAETTRVREHERKLTGDDDDATPLRPDPVSKAGDVWLLGPHRLVCGDCRDEAVVKAAVDGRMADMVWTDPPYGVAVNAVADEEEARRLNRRTDGLLVTNDDLSEDDLRSLLEAAFDAALVWTRPGACWWTAAPGGPLHVVFAGVLRERGLWRQTLVWVKDVFAFGRSDYHYRHEPIFYGWKPGAAHVAVPDRTQDSVWEIPRPRRSEEHPTMKPVELVARAVLNHTVPGDLVLDPFGGSGTTMIAAHDAGRVAALVELDPWYCDVVVERFRRHTGIEPVLADTGLTR